MSILAECPRCHKKQAVKNRICACGADLVKEKRSGKVRYWVNYRLPNGKQRREYVGNNPEGRPLGIEGARAAEGKRRAQKHENPAILEKAPAERMTFSELARWYLDLKSVQALASLPRVKCCLCNFTDSFGDRIVSSLKPVDLENYQHKRLEAGRTPATVDMELTIAKTMVLKAFDNDLVDGRTVKIFRKVKRQLRKGANARRQTLSVAGYLRLIQEAPPHLRALIVLAFNTGMRLGELRALQWKHIDREAGFIRLPSALTKEGRAKTIPMNHYVREVLDRLPRSIHHGFVITYHGQPITNEGGCKKAFKGACARAGIACGRDVEGGIIFHDLRRTVKTNMVTAGVDHVHRDLILGHSLRGMDVHYMWPSENDLKMAMNRYTKWIEAQMESVDHPVDQMSTKSS